MANSEKRKPLEPPVRMESAEGLERAVFEESTVKPERAVMNEKCREE